MGPHPLWQLEDLLPSLGLRAGMAVLGYEAAAWHAPDWWRRHWELSGLLEDVRAWWQEDGHNNWLLWARAVAAHRGAGEDAVLETLEADGGDEIGFVLAVGRSPVRGRKEKRQPPSRSVRLRRARRASGGYAPGRRRPRRGSRRDAGSGPARQRASPGTRSRQALAEMRRGRSRRARARRRLHCARRRPSSSNHEADRAARPSSARDRSVRASRETPEPGRRQPPASGLSRAEDRRPCVREAS